ncbi:hypothetical protein AMTRI_Chr13g88920 [Amborella trichopoda]
MFARSGLGPKNIFLSRSGLTFSIHHYDPVYIVANELYRLRHTIIISIQCMLSFGFRKSPRITLSHNLLINSPCFNPITIIIFLYQIIVYLPKAFFPSPTNSPLLSYLSSPPLFSHFLFYISDLLPFFLISLREIPFPPFPLFPSPTLSFPLSHLLKGSLVLHSPQ